MNRAVARRLLWRGVQSALLLAVLFLILFPIVWMALRVRLTITDVRRGGAAGRP